MKNKKGFELSIQFIVTIILAMAILGLGIILLRNFIGGAIETQQTLDSETNAQLERLLDSGSPVGLPLNRATIRRGDAHLFGLGIRNTDITAQFQVSIAISAAIDTANQDILSEVDLNEWLRYDREPFFLEKNERRKMSIRVEPPKDATKGTYIFNVDVTRNGDDYGTIKKFWVTIP